MSATIKCSKCKKFKTVSNFHKSKNRPNGLNCYCKDCRYVLNHRPDIMEQRRQAGRKHTLRVRYNLTLEDYNEMFEIQNGTCLICNKPEKRKLKNGIIFPLVVDHNHKTGQIRGLLCDRCNKVLGWIDENILLLKALEKYLKTYN